MGVGPTRETWRGKAWAVGQLGKSGEAKLVRWASYGKVERQSLGVGPAREKWRGAAPALGQLRKSGEAKLGRWAS